MKLKFNEPSPLNGLETNCGNQSTSCIFTWPSARCLLYLRIVDESIFYNFRLGQISDFNFLNTWLNCTPTMEPPTCLEVVGFKFYVKYLLPIDFMENQL